MGRVIGKFLYGSQNYQLSTLESDRDYKIIEFPSSAELFYKRELNRRLDENCSVWDVRFFLKSLMRANPNALELLFSVEQEYPSGDFKWLLEEHIRPRIGPIIRMNWKKFSNSLYGLASNSIKRNGVNGKTVSRYIYFFYLYLSVYNANGEMTEDTWRSIKIENVREIENKELLNKKVEIFYELWRLNKNSQLKPRENDEKICKDIENKILEYWGDVL